MRKATIMTMTVALLVGAAIAPVTTAGAKSANPGATDQGGSVASGTHDDQVVLRRDGASAVQFESVVGGAHTPALRRDGAKAVPFFAEASQPAGSADSGFDWGNATIAAISSGLILLGLASLLLFWRRASVRAVAPGAHGGASK
jgi:hypothetical protein